ncbi:fungal-specific transcription factor domain-containing protein [Coniochaeta sp. 2T2.1]|nr:fungal-specific transcription factor domain-containing protein [Coniochaeta sp. 2T2.1]
MDDSAHSQSQSQSSFKRQRTALACNSCRNRKSRCNGLRPKCTMCVEMGLEYVYQQPGHQQKKESVVEVEGRLSSIERTLQLLVEEHRRQNRDAPSRDAHSSSNTVRNIDVEHHGGAAPITDAAISEDRDTVDGMGAITFADEHESGFFGPSSNIAFIGQIATAITAAAGRAGSGPAASVPQTEDRFEGELTSVSRPASPFTYPGADVNGTSNAVDIYALPAEAEMLHLIQLFFNDTGMLFPYVDERSLLAEVHAVKQGNFASARRSWLCLLNMILAFATCVSARPDRPVEQNAAESNVYFERAQALLGNMAFKTVNVEIVQCLLLMTQYLQGIQRSAQTWKLHGLAVKAAFQLGLHTAYMSTKFTPLESEVRKRTWYGCVLLDRTLSMTFGRPPAVPNDYVKIDPPLDADLKAFGPNGALPSEPAASNSTVAFFTNTITLYQILGDVIANQYGQNVGMPSHASLSSLFESTIRLEGQLLSWKRNLPPLLRQRPWESGTSVNAGDTMMVWDRLSIILTLRYLNVRALLHRPVLARFLEQTHAPPGDGEDAHVLERFGHPSLEVSLEAAAETIDIIHRFRETPVILGAWWFSAYYTFNAALIIFSGLLVQSTNNSTFGNEAGGYVGQKDLQSSLHLAVEALHSLGDGTRLVRRCCKYLEILLRTVARLGKSPTTPSWQYDMSLMTNKTLIIPRHRQSSSTGRLGQYVTGTAGRRNRRAVR